MAHARDAPGSRHFIASSLSLMHARLDCSFGDGRPFATRAIRFYSERTKDGTSDELADPALHLLDSSEKPFEIPQYALDVHTRRGQLAGRSVDDFWGDGGGSEPVNEVAGREGSLKEEILRFRAAGQWWAWPARRGGRRASRASSRSPSAARRALVDIDAAIRPGRARKGPRDAASDEPITSHRRPRGHRRDTVLLRVAPARAAG